MLTKSCKAKGRLLQNLVQDYFYFYLGTDTKVRIMGEKGADICRDEKNWPFHIECKNREQLSIFAEITKLQSKNTVYPVLVVKKNKEIPVVIMEIDRFFDLLKASERGLFKVWRENEIN